MKSPLRIRKLLIAYAAASYAVFAWLLLIAATHGGIGGGPTAIVAAVFAPVTLPIVVCKNLKSGALPSYALPYIIAVYAIWFAVVLFLIRNKKRIQKQKPESISN